MTCRYHVQASALLHQHQRNLPDILFARLTAKSILSRLDIVGSSEWQDVQALRNIDIFPINAWINNTSKHQGSTSRTEQIHNTHPPPPNPLPTHPTPHPPIPTYSRNDTRTDPPPICIQHQQTRGRSFVVDIDVHRLAALRTELWAEVRRRRSRFRCGVRDVGLMMGLRHESRGGQCRVEGVIVGIRI